MVPCVRTFSGQAWWADHSAVSLPGCFTVLSASGPLRDFSSVVPSQHSRLVPKGRHSNFSRFNQPFFSAHPELESAVLAARSGSDHPPVPEQVCWEGLPVFGFSWHGCVISAILAGFPGRSWFGACHP